MDSDISMPISGCQVLPVAGDADAADALLNVLVSPHGELVDVVRALELYSFLVKVEGLRFKYVVIVFLNFFAILDEQDLAHIFAVSIPEQPSLNVRSGCASEGVLIDEVPEPHSPVTRARHEPCKSPIFLENWGDFIISIGEPNSKILVNSLNIVNWSIVGEEGPHHRHFLRILHIPEEYHLVAVDQQDPMSLVLVCYDSHNIRIFTFP